MSTPQRLPIVNQDDGTWGDIIRQFLMKEHYNDDSDSAANGGHQKVTIRAGTAAAGTAPLKFTSGTVLSAPETGAVEFNSDSLYFTITSGTTRKKVALYDDSFGATGDMYYRDSSGNFVQLGMSATAGQVLKSGTTPSWGYTNSGFKVYNPGGSYTVTASDTVVFADATSGNTTITLPAASGLTGYRFYIKRTDSSAHSVTIAASGADTIDGMTSFTLDLQYTAFGVVSNGSAWYIL
jgi:hypothetical protein